MKKAEKAIKAIHNCLTNCNFKLDRYGNFVSINKTDRIKFKKTAIRFETKGKDKRYIFIFGINPS